MKGRPEEPSLWKRLAWFVLLWAGGVLAVAAIAYALRAVIPTVQA